MEFIGLDEIFYEMRMKKKIPYEKKFKRLRLWLIIVLVYVVVGLILNYYVPATKGNMLIIVLMACAFPSVIWLTINLNAAYKDVKPFWNLMKLYRQPDQIMVFPDFHMEIKSYTGNYIHMGYIHTFRKNSKYDFLTVEYSCGNTVGNYPLKYDISYGMNDLETIEALLRFKIELQKGGKFANESMKKIFQMEPSLRNRLFVEELNSGELLMPIRLADELEYNEHCMLLFHDIYVMYEIDEQGYLCMYTSMQEITKQTHQEYPQCVHVNVKQIYSLLTQNYSPIFNESSTEFFITINRHNEKVNVSSAQLSKILVLQQQDQVTQLYTI